MYGTMLRVMAAPKTLATALDHAIHERGIGSISDAAERIGVTETTLRSVLHHGKRANARTLRKYAAFLRVPELTVREYSQANASTSATTRTFGGLGARPTRDNADLIDTGVRAIQEAGINHVLGKIPLPLIDAIRQLNPSELDALAKHVREMIASRGKDASNRILATEVERRARRIKRQRKSTLNPSIARR